MNQPNKPTPPANGRQEAAAAQPVEIPNPVLIDRISRGQTNDGRPVIDLYAGPLRYPVIRLPEFQFSLLFEAGIDPETVSGTKHTRFYAHWQYSEATKSTGSRYRDIASIEAAPDASTLALEAMAAELKVIKELLVYLAEQAAPEGTDGRQALIQWYKDRSKK